MSRVKTWLGRPAYFDTKFPFLAWSLNCVLIGVLLAGWVGLSR